MRSPHIFSAIVGVAIVFGTAIPTLAGMRSSESVRMAQAVTSPALEKLGLLFLTMTPKDKAISFIIPGDCPVDEAEYFCGFPSEPEVKEDFLTAGDGSPVKRVSVTGGAYEISFIVSILEYKFDFNAEENLATSVAIENELMVDEGGSTLAHIQYHSAPGKAAVDLVYTGYKSPKDSNTFTSFIRLIVVGNRQYRISTFTYDSNEATYRKDIDTFITNFRLLKDTSAGR